MSGIKMDLNGVDCPPLEKPRSEADDSFGRRELALWEIADTDRWIYDWVIENHHGCDTDLPGIVREGVLGKVCYEEVLERVSRELVRFSSVLRGLDNLPERFPKSHHVGANFAYLAWYHDWLIRCSMHFLGLPSAARLDEHLGHKETIHCLDRLADWLSEPLKVYAGFEPLIPIGLLKRDDLTGRYFVTFPNSFAAVADSKHLPLGALTAETGRLYLRTHEGHKFKKGTIEKYVTKSRDRAY